MLADAERQVRVRVAVDVEAPAGRRTRSRRGWPTCRTSTTLSPAAIVDAVQLGVGGRGAPEVVQRVRVAQDLLDRARERATGRRAARRAGRGAASSASRPDESIVLVVSLPAVTSCTKKLPNSMSVIGPPSKLPARMQRGEVVARLLGAALRGELRSRTSPCPSCRRRRLVRRASAVPRSAHDVGVLAAGVHLGPAGGSGRQSSRGQAHELADRPATAAARRRRGRTRRRAARAASPMISRQIARMRPSMLRDHAGLEARGERAPVVDVPRRVHRQQHVPHHARAGRGRGPRAPRRPRSPRTAPARGRRATTSACFSTAQNPGSSGISCQ